MAREVPLVIISNKEKTTTVDAINQDNTMVGRLMARHLLDLGHRDVAIITPPLTRRQWQRSKEGWTVFVKSLKEKAEGHVLIKAADESMDRTSKGWTRNIPCGIPADYGASERREYFTIAGQNDMEAGLGAIDAGKIQDPCTKDVS